MARKCSIGGIDEDVKAGFDEVQARMGAPSASVALGALVDFWRQAEAERGVDEAHVPGMRRVADGLERVRRDMSLVLSDVRAQADHDAEESLERVRALEAALAERDERLEEAGARAAEMGAELESALARAASVDALAERLAESEAAWRDRFDRLASAIETRPAPETTGGGDGAGRAGR